MQVRSRIVVTTPAFSGISPHFIQDVAGFSWLLDDVGYSPPDSNAGPESYIWSDRIANLCPAPGRLRPARGSSSRITGTVGKGKEHTR